MPEDHDIHYHAVPGYSRRQSAALATQADPPHGRETVVPPEDSPSAEKLLAAALEAGARLEQQLVEAQKMEAAGLLAAGVAHDFNNLLTVINGYSDILLARHELSAEARELIDGIREAGTRAAALVEALLNFSRPKPPYPRIVDLNQCALDVTALVVRLLPPDIEFRTAAEAHLNMVRADPGGLQQVLLNLVFNARDAMPRGGTLEIGTANVTVDAASSGGHPGVPAGSYVLLTVRDTGSGMDSLTRQRIFEPFYTGKPEGAGTGLGLTMVRYVVKQNGGYLAVESQEARGTSIRIYLPAVAAEEAAQSPEPAQAPPGGHETVLVVESDRAMRRFLLAVLEGLGYTVHEATSAREAEVLASGFRIDLLLANTSLADSTGVVLASCLRDTRPGLPVLLISSHLQPAGNLPAVSEPSVDFLTKPFTVADLAQSLRRLLDLQKRRRILFVDDDAGVVLFAMRVLREAGWEVLPAGNWKVALHTLETEHPDLVITEVVMPGVLETSRTLRKSHPSVPVIAISDASALQFLKTAAGLDARATLTKPFTAEQLLEAVRQALGASA